MSGLELVSLVWPVLAVALLIGAGVGLLWLDGRTRRRVR
jgi:hypothetical protein